MVAPLSPLMESFKAIANNDNLSDETYVFVKGGRAKTETRLQHHFTSRDRKEKTAQRLLASMKAQYGNRIGESLAPFLADFAHGEHQVKVGTLRRLFKEAESAQLSQIRAALPALSDALAPLEAHIARGRVVTHEQVGDVVRGYYRNAGIVAMATHQEADLGALTSLCQEADQSARMLLSALEEPVEEAVVEFCRRGDMTKASLFAVLQEKFGVDVKAKGVKWPLLTLLPNDDVTPKQAADFFVQVQKEKNQQVIQAFIDELNDPILCAVADLKGFLLEGLDFSPEFGRSYVEMRKAPAKPWIDAAREVMAEAAADGVALPEDFEEELAELVVRHAKSGRAPAIDVPEMKREAKEKLLLKTNFDAALEHVVREAGFSPAMEAAYRDAMLYLKETVPPEDFFMKHSSVGSRLATSIKYGSFDGVEDPASLMKAAVIVGMNQLEWLKGRQAELSAAFKAGAVNISNICTILYGKGTPSPVLDAGKSLADRHDAFDQFHSDMCARIYARLPGVGRPQDESWMTTLIKANSLLSGGLKLESALAILKDPTRPFTLEDLVLPPESDIRGFETIERAEHEVEANFSRQRRPGQPLGEAIVTVTQPDESGMVIDNSTEGMSAEEVAQFVQQERTATHEKLFAALKTLCGDNEAQYRRALAELTPFGTPFFMKMLFPMRGVAKSGLEHVPLEVSYCKAADGSIVVESCTPEDPRIAQLRTRIVIRPDGTSEYETLSITPATADEDEAA